MYIYWESYHPQIELSKFIANLKTVSSRLIRKEFGDYLDKIYRKPVFTDRFLCKLLVAAG
ncbi:MAG TPA: hypothetical protein DDW76_00070 [Cyanobacteria bacterium UBA11369]|nr:hypothetical protein [Cyanobacteria bacterium UBA11371]HBE47241.1 hypothetical protein [Cyanobacteria bacterium UBA11369]